MEIKYLIIIEIGLKDYSKMETNGKGINYNGNRCELLFK